VWLPRPANPIPQGPGHRNHAVNAAFLASDVKAHPIAVASRTPPTMALRYD
jgi:hypothetical protein